MKRPLRTSVVATSLAISAVVLACTPSQDAPTTVAPTASVAPSASAASAAPSKPTGRQSDVVATQKGDLRITPLHHGSLVLVWAGKTYFVDPAEGAVFDGLPKADVVFITDIHPDHLNPPSIDQIKQASTVIVAPQAVMSQLPPAYDKRILVKNGDKVDVMGVGVEGIPMYNLQRGPSPGKLFHDKGRGDGFVLTFADKRVHLSGDTECTDEMKALKNIDVAFVCMNLPYTMPPSEAAQCIKAFQPKVLYPYHYKGSDLGELKASLAGQTGIEVRERAWY